MKKRVVSITRYESSLDSLAKAIEDAKGFEKLDPRKQVLIKPNLVGWDPYYPIAPYGVYTTSRLVEDMVILLKDYGVRDITIGEGSAPRGGKKAGKLRGTKLIFSALGYEHLQRKYGVRLLDFFDEPFQTVNLGDFSLNFAQAALRADFVINMPVLKTHNQTILSLGLKNLKGCIDLKSRRISHNEKVPLDFFCALFAEAIRPALTVLDGIYGLEKGPYYLGTARRMNVIVASQDPLGVDVIGAMLAGYEPSAIKHIAIYAKRNHRSLDLEAFALKGFGLETFIRPFKWDFNWREDNTGPKSWDKLGISGISVPKYDQTICTGCSSMYNPLLMLIRSAYKGKPFDGIEVLTGKKMTPSPGFNKTVLFGNCMIKKNRQNPNIRKLVCIKGCPVTMEELIKKLREMGLDIDVGFYAKFRKSLAKRYDQNPDFDPSHYFMPGAIGNQKDAAFLE